MDHFDDVSYTELVEEPAPLSPRTRLRRRVAVVMTAAIVGFGGVAAVADALTSSPHAATKQAAPSYRPHVTYNADGVPTARSGPECKAGQGHRFKRRDDADRLKN